jgi:hypothetical protein
MASRRTLLQWTDASGATGLLELDATPVRGFEQAAEVTEFPVETGSAITDHVRPLNPTVALEGVVSNTPIVAPATQLNGATQGPGVVQLRGPDGAVKASLIRFSRALDRVKLCDELLAGLVTSGTPVKLTTTLRTIENLAITRYKVDQDATTGESIKVTLELKRLRIVSTARSAVPAVRRLQVTSNRAVQPPDDRSALARIADGGAPADAARQRAREALRRGWGF